MSGRSTVVESLRSRDDGWKSALRPFKAAEGEVLFEGSGPPSHLYAPATGMVGIMYGTDRAISLCGPGSLVGAHGLSPNGHLQFTAVAVTPVAGLRAPSGKARQICEASPASRSIVEAMSRALTHEVAMNFDLALERSTLPRMALYLLLMQESLGDRLLFTHVQIAALAGMRRPSVTENIQSLAEAGVVRGERGYLDILRTADLVALVGDGWRHRRALLDAAA